MKEEKYIEAVIDPERARKLQAIAAACGLPVSEFLGLLFLEAAALVLKKTAKAATDSKLAALQAELDSRKKVDKCLN